jgi:hypothetical protein
MVSKEGEQSIAELAAQNLPDALSPTPAPDRKLLLEQRTTEGKYDDSDYID